MGVVLRSKMYHLLLFLYLLLSNTTSLVIRRDNSKEHMGVRKDIKKQAMEVQSTTWDPWAPCETDADCPDYLLCNTYQRRCTECMDNSDCPVCLGEGCPFPGAGVCVYGDHCCTNTYC